MLPLAIASFVLMCLALGNPFAPCSECAGYDFFDPDNGTAAVNPDITDLNSSSWTAVASDAVTADGIYDPRHGGCMLRNEIEYEVQLVALLHWLTIVESCVLACSCCCFCGMCVLPHCFSQVGRLAPRMKKIGPKIPTGWRQPA